METAPPGVPLPACRDKAALDSVRGLVVSPTLKQMSPPSLCALPAKSEKLPDADASPERRDRSPASSRALPLVVPPHPEQMDTPAATPAPVPTATQIAAPIPEPPEPTSKLIAPPWSPVIASPELRRSMPEFPVPVGAVKASSAPVWAFVCAEEKLAAPV